MKTIYLDVTFPDGSISKLVVNIREDIPFSDDDYEELQDDINSYAMNIDDWTPEELIETVMADRGWDYRYSAPIFMAEPV